MTLLGHPVCVKPYLLMDIPHMLNFFVHLWYYNIEEIYGLDLCSDIGTAIVLGTLYMIY